MSEFTYRYAHIHMRNEITMDELIEAQIKYLEQKKSSNKNEELIDAYEWLFTKIDTNKILIRSC